MAKTRIFSYETQTEFGIAKLTNDLDFEALLQVKINKNSGFDDLARQTFEFIKLNSKVDKHYFASLETAFQTEKVVFQMLANGEI